MVENNVKSGPSRIESLLTFVNKTERTVDVIWLNHQGQPHRYKVLQPLQTVNVNTYVGHPWIFRDRFSGDALAVESKEVFFPKPSTSVAPQRRRHIFITLPGNQYTVEKITNGLQAILIGPVHKAKQLACYQNNFHLIF